VGRVRPAAERAFQPGQSSRGLPPCQELDDQADARMSRGHRGQKAGAASTVLLAVAVGLPILLGALHLVSRSMPALDDVVTLLEGRDDGRFLEVVIGTGVWVCWLLFTASTAAEV
jgi:hypothetical protein